MRFSISARSLAARSASVARQPLQAPRNTSTSAAAEVRTRCDEDIASRGALMKGVHVHDGPAALASRYSMPGTDRPELRGGARRVEPAPAHAWGTSAASREDTTT